MFKIINFEKLLILNNHLEQGTIPYKNQKSISILKYLVFNGYLYYIENHLIILTKKGFKTTMKYRKLFLTWKFFKKIKPFKNLRSLYYGLFKKYDKLEKLWD